jgi:DNA-binding winged helix-turn-helix (wHTH) protein
MLSFPPFQLDIEDERLWKSGVDTQLRRKPFAILCYLAQNPQRLVRYKELVDAVWGRKFAMSDSLLRTHLCSLRQVLGGGVVETVVGRGYRFLPEVTYSDADARRSDANTIFVSSEAGVGKTTPVRALLERSIATDSVLVSWRTCVEYHGIGEARVPVPQAFDTRRRGRGASRVIDVLGARMPVLVFDDLQWSDPSTARLMTFLSRRREPANF